MHSDAANSTSIAVLAIAGLALQAYAPAVRSDEQANPAAIEEFDAAPTDIPQLTAVRQLNGARLPGASVKSFDDDSTLRGSILAALAYSSEVRTAEADRANASVEIAIARSGYQPTLRSSAGFANDDTYDYELTLSQPLYDWGQTSARVTGARAGHTAATTKLVATGENIALEAATAHIGVKQSESLVAAAEDNLVAYRRIGGLARDRTRSGVGDATEAELAGVHEGEAQSALEDARDALRNARTMYFSRVGVEARRLGAVPELALALPDGTIDEAVVEAPVVQAARARERAARAAIKAERGGLRPTLTAEAYVRSGGILEERDSGIRLRINGPALVGLSNARRVEAARLQADSAVWAVETAQRDVSLRVLSLIERAPTLRTRIDILQDQLERAGNLRALYEDQFVLGRRSLVDLVNVQGDVFRIQRSLIDTRFTIVDLQYRAAAALGMLQQTLGITPEARRR